MTTDRTQPPSDEIMGKVVAKWKPLEMYGGVIEVSSDGRVRSIDRYVPGRGGVGVRLNRGRVLKQREIRGGYLRVSFAIDGTEYQHPVHRLVAVAFIGEPPTDRHQINHINGNKKDNRPSNLEWVTARQNIQHAFDNGLNTPNYGTDNGSSKLHPLSVRVIRRACSEHGFTHQQIGEIFGVSRSLIGLIMNRKIWRAV